MFRSPTNHAAAGLRALPLPLLLVLLLALSPAPVR
jgi:hypothetical protein